MANIRTADRKAKRPLAFRRKRGASLAEMMIAIVVLAVVLISMLGMFVIARTAIYTKEDETAYALALRYMEQLEEMEFAELLPMLKDNDRNNWSDQKYATRAILLEDKENENKYLAKVRVEVTWSSAGPCEKTVEMERVISAFGYKNVGETR